MNRTMQSGERTGKERGEVRCRVVYRWCKIQRVRAQVRGYQAVGSAGAAHRSNPSASAPVQSSAERPSPWSRSFSAPPRCSGRRHLWGELGASLGHPHIGLQQGRIQAVSWPRLGCQSTWQLGAWGHCMSPMGGQLLTQIHDALCPRNVRVTCAKHALRPA